MYNIITYEQYIKQYIKHLLIIIIILVTFLHRYFIFYAFTYLHKNHIFYSLNSLTQLNFYGYTYSLSSKKRNSLANPTHRWVHYPLCSHLVARVIILICHLADIQHSRLLINMVSQTRTCFCCSSGTIIEIYCKSRTEHSGIYYMIYT